MRQTIVLFCSFILFISSVSAQKLSSIQQKKVDDLYKSTSVVYFQFNVTSSQEIAPLAQVVSVDGVKGTGVRAHATKDQFTKFIVKNYAYTVLPHKATPKKSGAKKPNAKKKAPAKKK